MLPRTLFVSSQLNSECLLSLIDLADNACIRLETFRRQAVYLLQAQCPGNSAHRLHIRLWILI